MRGPGLRVSIDVRRTWRCPRCGYERHAPATETTVRCHCSGDDPWMKLVEPLRKVRPPVGPLDVYFEYTPDPEERRSAEPEAHPPGETAGPAGPSLHEVALVLPGSAQADDGAEGLDGVRLDDDGTGHDAATSDPAVPLPAGPGADAEQSKGPRSRRRRRKNPRSPGQ